MNNERFSKGTSSRSYKLIYLCLILLKRTRLKAKVKTNKLLKILMAGLMKIRLMALLTMQYTTKNQWMIRWELTKKLSLRGKRRSIRDRRRNVKSRRD